MLEKADAILVQTGSQNILIDGGPGSEAIGLELSQKMPFWDRQIDLIILTHPHSDHLSGLVEVLHRYRVKQVMDPGLASTSPIYSEFLQQIYDKNIPYMRIQSGYQIKLQNGAYLEILNPTDISFSGTEAELENNGIVSKLVFGKISFLLTADIGEQTEVDLLKQRANFSSTVLKVAHHGSGSSTSASFLSVARPQIAVITVGEDNTFGHPDAEVMERLGQIPVYRTDIHGSIEFTTDGQKLWVKTDRQ